MSRVDVKIVLLGSEAVGKTSLMRRYVHEQFSNRPHQNTIGAAFASKLVSSKGRKFLLGIWDTAGSERYYAMSRLYYRDAKAAIVCFDISDNASFVKAKQWVTELRNHEPSCRIYLCGTQKDVVDDGLRARTVSIEKVALYAKGMESVYLETSSKTGENVAKLFQTIADECELPSPQLQNNSVKLHHEQKTWNCCVTA